jgi:hypothetical protein
MLRLTKIVESSVLIALMLPMGGCIIWPNYCVERAGVKSRVVDADTGIPVKGAAVCDTRNQKRACTADDSGAFKLRPTYHWHGGYWLAGIALKILPATHDIIMPSFAISIAAPGYETTSFANAKDEDLLPPPVISPNQAVEAQFDGTYFHLPRLALKRTTQATSQRAATTAPTP